MIKLEKQRFSWCNRYDAIPILLLLAGAAGWFAWKEMRKPKHYLDQHFPEWRTAIPVVGGKPGQALTRYPHVEMAVDDGCVWMRPYGTKWHRVVDRKTGRIVSLGTFTLGETAYCVQEDETVFIASILGPNNLRVEVEK